MFVVNVLEWFKVWVFIGFLCLFVAGEPSFGPRIENVTRGILRRMKKVDGNGQCFANSRKSPSEKSDVYTKETSLDVAFPSKYNVNDWSTFGCVQSELKKNLDGMTYKHA
ncbi:hypothetical protein ACFE04_000613 [Oxalis oulophora]